jgi:hypothetical protein
MTCTEADTFIPRSNLRFRSRLIARRFSGDHTRFKPVDLDVYMGYGTALSYFVSAYAYGTCGMGARTLREATIRTLTLVGICL